MIGQDINYAAKLLKEGKVVAIPTETVYGLAGNALNLEAVSEIFAVKQRPAFDPLIIHLGYVEQIPQWITHFPSKLAVLAKYFMPGPLTLLLEKNQRIPDLVTSGSNRVAVRIPGHPLSRKLLQQLDFPLAAPSANPFGYISPTTAKHVAQQLGEKIPYILDGGASEVGLESTIVGLEEEQLTIYRKGGLAIEQIEQIVGRVKVKSHSTSNPSAPGMLKSHYAPNVPFEIGDPLEYMNKFEPQKIGALFFKKEVSQLLSKNQVQLSKDGDFKEAAQNLFAAMRYLDNLDLKIIVAELLPEEGLGRAINDRLRRAAVRE